jgi:tetratricopeptide (TPR) repeat protein
VGKISECRPVGMQQPLWDDEGLRRVSAPEGRPHITLTTTPEAFVNPFIATAGTGLLAYAAVTIPRNARKARAQKNARQSAEKPLVIDAAAYGLVPAAQLDTRFAGPDPQADAVAEAAVAGDWQQAAAYLDEAGRDWDLRWYRLGILAHAAVQDDRWLKSWWATYPYDPSAALVVADTLTSLASKARGAKRAKYTTSEQFAAFHHLLAEALPACREAARLAPDDPSPWIAQISIALGLGWSHDDFRSLWAQITARAPHHHGAHLGALQYWCDKWRGSQELMFAFAEEAAAAAPSGSLLPVLRLYAAFEHEHQTRDRGIYQQPFMRTAIDATLDAVDRVPPDHYRLPTVRHLLANALFRTERYAEAVEQFRAIGGFIGGVPWSYSVDPVKEFVHARTNTFVEWEKAGRPAAPARR